MIEIHVDYQGALRCRAVHGPSGESLITDAPVDNRGQGQAFSPTDLLATATATCMLTIMGIRARDRDWPLEGARIRVEKHMSGEAPRRVARLRIQVSLPGSLDDAALAELREAALNCPVMLSLHPDIVVDHDFSRG